MNTFSSIIKDSKLKKEHLYDKQGIFRIDFLEQYLSCSRKLDNEVLNQLLNHFISICINQPSLLKLTHPIIIVGDLHGQYEDLKRILKTQKEDQKILFLGDYVDRGTQSVEVMIHLMVLKILKPKQVYLLRGNHQSLNQTTMYGFKSECCFKYSHDTYTRMNDCFQSLPIAAKINDQFFCVHGGISSNIQNIQDLNKIDRIKEIPQIGQMCDLMWADPSQDENGGEKETPNLSRGCSVVFTKKDTDNFLTKNNLQCIIRAHESFRQGYKFYWNYNTSDGLPKVITLFSAPNYCGNGHKASYAKIKKGKLSIKQFQQSSNIRNPLSQKLQVFAWAVPETLRVANYIFNMYLNGFTQLYFKESAHLDSEIKMNHALLLHKYLKTTPQQHLNKQNK